ERFADVTRGRTVTLRRTPKGLQWEYEAAEIERLRELVERIRSLEYTTQRALAKAMNVSPATVNRDIDKILFTHKLMTKADYEACIQAARRQASGITEGDFDGEPEGEPGGTPGGEPEPFDF